MCRVGFVVPARNAERTLPACLAAIAAAARGVEAEIIVVANGCTDRTAAAAASFPARVVEAREPGRAQARNCGLQLSSAPWIAFVDADTNVSADWLTCCLHAAQSFRLAAVQGEVKIRSARLESGSSERQAAARRFNSALFASGEALPTIDTCAALFRREALLEIKGFDESLPDYEDTDLTWRLLAGGYACGTAAACAEKYHDPRLLVDLRRAYERGAACTRLLAKWGKFFDEPHTTGWNRRYGAVALDARALRQSAAALLLRGAFFAGILHETVRLGRCVPAMPPIAVSSRRPLAAPRLVLARDWSFFLDSDALRLFNLRRLRSLRLSGVHRELAAGLLVGEEQEPLISRALAAYTISRIDAVNELQRLTGHLLHSGVLEEQAGG